MPNDEKSRFDGFLPKEPTEEDSLFDRLFNEAAARHLAEDQTYPSKEELEKEITFSPEFEARMTAQFRRWRKEARHKKRSGRAAVYLVKAATVMIAFSLIFGVFVVTSTAARNRVFNFFNRLTDVSVDIDFYDEPGAGGDEVFVIPKNAYRPDFLPEGFSLDAVSAMDSVTELWYTYGDQSIQIATYTGAHSITLNRENTTSSTFRCLGVTATQLAAEKDVIIYFKKDNAFVMLNANIPADDLRKVAKSLKK